MHAPDAACGDKVGGPARQMYIRLAAGFVAHADEPPGDRMAERLAGRFLRGERAGEPFVRRAMALRVCQFFGRENFAREFFELRRTETKAIDFCDVGSDSDDHRKAARTTPACRPKDLHPIG